MSLETSPQFINDLNRLWPLGSDQKRYGDDNLRNLKLALQNCMGGFPGSVIVTGTDGGAANAYTVNPAVLPPSLGNKMTVVFSPVASNTGACTLNYAALGAKALRSVSGAALVAGDLVAGNLYAAFYNGTEFRLLSVTTAYVDAVREYATQLAFATALPAQPGTPVPFILKTINGSASWGKPDLIRVPRTANTVIDATNCGNLIDITANTFTQTFAAIASFPANAFFYLQNSGSGDITIDPSGAETIDGLTSFVMYPREMRLVYKDETGLLWKSIVIRAFYRKATTNYTFVKPPGYATIGWDGVGGSGGAGAGCKGAAGNDRPGGSPGGTPSRVRRLFAGLTDGASYAQVIGAAGTSAAVQTVDNTSGASGTNGGNTSFGSLAIAYGGIGGRGGDYPSSGTYYMTTGSGSYGLGSSTTTSGLGFIPGGDPNFSFNNGGNLVYVTTEEGGAGAQASNGVNSMWGGASATTVPGTGGAVNSSASGSSAFGVPAGGWGASITAANTFTPAPPAGASNSWTRGAGAVGGTSGAVPTVGANGAATGGTDFDMGNSGAGGGASITLNVSGARGGNGNGPGAAGGGGGATTNGTGSGGAGGTSQPGQSITWGNAA